MSTQRQKKLAKAIAENQAKDKPEPIGQILESIGYSKNTAEAIPGQIVSAEGVIEELEKLGFSEHKAKEVVGIILTDTNQDSNVRLKAADMIFKVKGSYAPEKSVNLNVNAEIDNSKFKAIKEKYEAELLKEIENE